MAESSISARWVLALVVVAGLAPAAFADIVSYAQVNDDATLTVRGRIIRLYGIHIPRSERICRSRMKPVRCAPRAALALDFRIQGFVRCEPLAEHRDRSITARCRTERDDVDLSEYLLGQGWAMALPGAPFSFHAIERIARRRALGVWGVPADVIER